MAYRSRYRRRLPSRKKHNIFGTVILIIVILFIAFNWILPNLINGLGFINKTIKPVSNKNESTGENPTLAPPVLLIPYEATNSAEINISGYSQANSTVKIYLDDNLITETKPKDDGSFTTLGIPLNLGTNNIYGKTTDERGQDSFSSKIIRLIFDNEKPFLDVFQPQDNLTSHDKNIKVTGKTEQGSVLYVNNNRTIISEDGSFQTLIGLNEGDNIIVIKTHDKAGNLTEIQRKVTYQP